MKNTHTKKRFGCWFKPWCLWESPWFNPYMFSLPSANLPVCACALPVCQATVREHDSLLHTPRWPPRCTLECTREHAQVDVDMLEGHMHLLLCSCNHHSFLVLSAPAIKSRCGISWRTRLQSDQLFKLQLSLSGGNVCVFNLFAHVVPAWLKMP